MVDSSKILPKHWTILKRTASLKLWLKYPQICRQPVSLTDELNFLYAGLSQQ